MNRGALAVLTEIEGAEGGICLDFRASDTV
jgi:hypothetical protein